MKGRDTEARGFLQGGAEPGLPTPPLYTHYQISIPVLLDLKDKIFSNKAIFWIKDLRESHFCMFYVCLSLSLFQTHYPLDYFKEYKKNTDRIGLVRCVHSIYESNI